MTATVEGLLSRLDGVSRTAGGYLARCRAHDDRRASLSISEGADGRLLLKCFAGCETEQVVEALGLSMKDLFADTGGPDPEPRIVKEYDYRDEAGALLFQVVRYEPKDFRPRRPDGHGGWLRNLNGTRRIPYRLHDLVKGKPESLFIVEGEKDADQLWSLGLPATCNPSGAGQWRKEYTETLLKTLSLREVLILADNDEPGRKHARDVARSFLGKVEVVTLIETLPNVPAKGDVSDYLRTHSKAELWAVIEQTPALRLQDLGRQSENDGGCSSEPGQAEAAIKPLSILAAGEFLAHPFSPVNNILAGGNLTVGGKLLIAGPGGIGKSLIDLTLGICLTARRPVFGEFAVTAPQRVGLFLCEDPAGVTQDRLRRQLAGMGLSEPPDGLFVFPRDERLVFGGRHGNPQESIGRLIETVKRHALSVVIFDPLVSIHEADENSNTEMSRWLVPLGDALQRESCAIIVSHHTTWGQDGEPHSRGASAIQNWADVVWLLRRIETGGREAVKLSVAKVNFGPRWEPLILTLDPESLLFRAEAEQSALCPVTGLLEYLRDEHGGEFRGKKGDIYKLVQARFGCGERTVREAFHAALNHQPPLLRDLGRGGGFEVIG